MTEDKKRDERSKLEKATDEALLIRPSGQPPLTSLDQISYNYYTPSSTDEGFNIHEIWRRIRKRKWLVLTLTFIATLIVTVVAFQTKSMYRAVSKIALNRDNSTVVKLGDAVLERNDSDRIKTDLLVLQTFPLLEEVVIRLKLDQNPAFLDTGGRSARESIVSMFKRKAPREKVAEPHARTSDEVQNPSFEPSQRTPEESDKLTPYVDALSESLYVEQIPETSAIQITFTHTDPQLAAQIANTVAQVFIDFSFENKTARFNKSATWLDETTRKLLAQMQKAEQELANYGQANNFYSTDEKTNLVGDKLANLYSQALKAETDRMIKQSLMQEVSEGRVGKLTEAFADQRTTQLQAELGKLQLQLASLSSRYGPDNPKVQEVERQTNEVKQIIADNTKVLESKLRADFERAMRDENLIKQSLDHAKAEAIQQNQASIKFGILKQNVETTKSLYNDFLNKTSQANIQRAEQNNDLRLIEPARIGKLIGPKRPRAILVGLFLSLIGSIGLALLLEYLDNTVKNVQDVSRATQLPTLALIPSMDAAAVKSVFSGQKNEQPPLLTAALRDKRGDEKKTDGLAGLASAARSLTPQGNKPTAAETVSSIVEAYRMLRTSVLLSTAGTPPKTILITSSQPGEGKTTTAVNTAVSLSQLGSSILLIDADLRRPAVHKTFRIPGNRGITNYLSSNTPIDDLIVDVGVPNLSLLPCGPIPPNPAELISSERMKDLIRVMSERYDHIIIDSPPLISVTDPVILSTLVDGAILVVHAGRSTRDLVRRARQELSGVGAKIFGVVLNNVDVKKEGYNDYYYYRYNSRYGDGQHGASAG